MTIGLQCAHTYCTWLHELRMLQHKHFCSCLCIPVHAYTASHSISKYAFRVYTNLQENSLPNTYTVTYHQSVRFKRNSGYSLRWVVPLCLTPLSTLPSPASTWGSDFLHLPVWPPENTAWTYCCTVAVGLANAMYSNNAPSFLQVGKMKSFLMSSSISKQPTFGETVRVMNHRQNVLWVLFIVVY